MPRSRTAGFISPLIRVVATAGFFAAGCAGGDGDQDTTEKRSNLYLHGSTWANGVVDVCYDGGDGNNPPLLAEARRQLAYSWSQAANIQFIDWGQCNYGATQNPRSLVAIHFVPNSNGYTDHFGPRSALPIPFGGYYPGVINVTLISNDADPLFKQQFRYEVLHEFGHALGFDHEQERPDNWIDNGWFEDPTPIYCDQLDHGQRDDSGGQYLTEYFDYDSIMDYCSSDPLNHWLRTTLSGGDIYGARQVYGRNNAAHGFMIRSDTNTGLAVNAWGGAAPGTVLKLSDACTESNPDCTWTYQYGMLVSDRDPSLAIKIFEQDGQGAAPHLSRGCSVDNPTCTWTYQDGEFRSDLHPDLALNAWLGAQNGTTVVLYGGCTPTDTNCRWTIQQAMLSSARNTALGVNAWNGAVIGVDLRLINFCTVYDANCTWRFHRGMIFSTSNPSLAFRPAGGAADGNAVELTNTCNLIDADCRWRWQKGQLVNVSTSAPFPINAFEGARHLGPLQLNSGCNEQNPDCVFNGLFARN